jgi:hypothetical protein
MAPNLKTMRFFIAGPTRAARKFLRLVSEEFQPEERINVAGVFRETGSRWTYSQSDGGQRGLVKEICKRSALNHAVSNQLQIGGTSLGL